MYIVLLILLYIILSDRSMYVLGAESTVAKLQVMMALGSTPGATDASHGCDESAPWFSLLKPLSVRF